MTDNPSLSIDLPIARELFNNGCQEESNTGDISCFYCRVVLDNTDPHEDNCFYMKVAEFCDEHEGI